MQMPLSGIMHMMLQSMQTTHTKLAAGEVPRIVYISCNPATFARDARVLMDGGYALDAVQPVDQFLWSSHVELASVFRRT